MVLCGRPRGSAFPPSTIEHLQADVVDRQVVVSQIVISRHDVCHRLPIIVSQRIDPEILRTLPDAISHYLPVTSAVSNFTNPQQLFTQYAFPPESSSFYNINYDLTLLLLLQHNRQYG